MNHMKKWLAAALAAAMILSMAACGSASDSAAASSAAASAASSAAVSAAESAETEEPAAEAEEPAEEEAAPAEASAAEAEEAPAAEAEEAAEPEEDENVTYNDDGERVVTVTDMSGDEVTVTGEVKNIINLWPAGTSSFFVMGAGDLVKGLAVNNAGTVNSWSKILYSAAGDIPALGGTSPTVEELLELDPDLVIIHPMTVADGYAQQIRDAGIPAININFSTYDTMIQSYTMIGEILGGEYQEKLDNWCQMIQDKQAEVEAVTASVADEDRPVVYYIGGQSDSLTTTMGSDSICADWTRIAGGTYAMDLMSDPTATEVTAEEIFAIDPDIIIVGGTYQHKLLEELQTTDGWKDLSAVVNGRVYTNPYGAFAWDRFGLESYLQMDYATLCIQPELAAANGITEDSIKAEAKEFYETMSGVTLTDEQLDNMMAGLEPDGTELDPDAAGAGMGARGGQGQGQGQGQSGQGGN